MKILPRLALVSCLGLLSCATTPPADRRAVDFDPQALWQAQWAGDAQTEAQLLEQAGWDTTGSVEAERYRQSWRARIGERGLMLAELAELRAARPLDPDLAYLEARLLQDPVRLEQRFADLARQHPQHAWIQLGAAGTALAAGDLAQAQVHLRAAPRWPDAMGFRELLEARLAAARGDREAWRGLLEPAFRRGSPAALAEAELLARDLDLPRLREAVAAERSLREWMHRPQTEANESERVACLLRRMHAELSLLPQSAFPALLARADGWAESLGLPLLWGSARRYRLPFGAGLLLQPETASDPWADWMAAQDRLVLLGWGWTQGTQMLELHAVGRHQVDWPGVEQPIEIIRAEGARGDTIWVSGGAVFRGFFVRADLCRLQGQARARACAEIPAAGRAVELAAVPTLAGPVGALPEDLDLPLRLRAALCAGDPDRAAAWEWQALLLHEAGHLPDVLPWCRPAGAAWLPELGRALRSWWRDGWALSEWEYRAALRALASGEATLWTLADLVETARDPGQPYHRPYRRLLRRLVQTARQTGLPALALWDQLSPVQLSGLAQQVAEQDGISLLDPAAVTALLAAVGPLDAAAPPGAR